MWHEGRALKQLAIWSNANYSYLAISDKSICVWISEKLLHLFILHSAHGEPVSSKRCPYKCGLGHGMCS